MIEVTVLDRAGKPLKGAGVEVRWGDGEACVEGASDEEGRAVIRGLPAGTVYLNVYHWPAGWTLSVEAVVTAGKT